MMQGRTHYFECEGIGPGGGVRDKAERASRGGGIRGDWCSGGGKGRRPVIKSPTYDPVGGLGSTSISVRCTMTVL